MRAASSRLNTSLTTNALDGRTAAQGPSSGQRWDYLDQLRAGLMLLGIPFHTALVYSSHLPWNVNSPDKSQLLTWAAQFSHTFRMPAFFLLSGFFAMLLIQRRDTSAWWKSRLLRLGVPLVSAALLINPMIMLAKSFSAAGHRYALAEWMEQLSSLGGHWVEHLWFLVHLLLYSTALAWLWHHREALRLERALRAFQDFMERRRVHAWVVLLSAGAVTVAIAAAAKFAGINYILYGMLSPTQVAADAPVFLFGALLAYRLKWLDAFTRPNRTIWIAGLLTAVVLAVVQSKSGSLNRAITFFLIPIVGILFSHLLLSSARRWLNSSTAFTRTMVDASMTMYLVHLVFVCWLAYAFLTVHLSPLVEFLTIAVLATLGSLAVHLVVKRSPLLLLLFNGRAGFDPLRKRHAELRHGAARTSS